MATPQLKKRYKVSALDLDPNTIDASNYTTEDEDTTTIGQDYKNANGSNWLFICAMGAKSDFRQVVYNLATVGLQSNWEAVSAAIDYIHATSVSTVIRVYQEVYRHKNANQPDTRPRTIIDSKQLVAKLQAFLADDSDDPLVATVRVPYADSTKTEAGVLSALDTFRPYLGFGEGTQDGISGIKMPENVAKYPMK